MADVLEEHGFKVKRGVAGMPSAFVATYGSGKPVIGMMGELDALPSISNKAVPYKEPLVEGGPGHGCGHNSYAATALGASLALKAVMEEENLPGTIKCFGCPAEETLVGKVFMVRDGFFDGLDACLGHHPGSMNTSGLRSGNAMNSVKFEFFGKASHAAGSPEQGISAMDAVELMNVGVNYMREHIVQEARVHYIVEDGGVQPNVVPPYARTLYSSELLAGTSWTDTTRGSSRWRREPTSWLRPPTRWSSSPESTTGYPTGPSPSRWWRT